MLSLIGPTHRDFCRNRNPYRQTMSHPFTKQQSRHPLSLRPPGNPTNPEGQSGPFVGGKASYFPSRNSFKSHPPSPRSRQSRCLMHPLVRSTTLRMMTWRPLRSKSGTHGDGPLVNGLFRFTNGRERLRRWLGRSHSLGRRRLPPHALGGSHGPLKIVSASRTTLKITCLNRSCPLECEDRQNHLGTMPRIVAVLRKPRRVQCQLSCGTRPRMPISCPDDHPLDHLQTCLT